MAFDDGFLDELKGRARLVDVIGRRVKLVKRGREWAGLSPFNAEKTPSFYVNEQKGFFHCFSSGEHGDVIAFVMKTEGLSFVEAAEKLAGEVGLEVPRQRRDPEREERRTGLIDALEAAAAWFEQQLAAPAGREGRAYLVRRGLVGATIAHFRLGWAPAHRTLLKETLLPRGFAEAVLVEAGLLVVPEAGGATYDRFRERVIFPITDRRGRVVAFGGRAMGDAKPKYLNSPETPLFHKGAMLYNLAGAREAAHRAGRVLVAEGYMDVIALHRAGHGHAVAPLGTALTEEQLGLLWRMAPEPTICLDGDAAGRRAAARAAERALPLLQPGQSLNFAELPPGEDPDSLLKSEGPAALARVLAATQPLAELLWRHTIEGKPLDTPERRAGLRRDLADLVAQIQDPTVRSYYQEDMRRRTDALFATPRSRPSRSFADRRGGGGGRRWPPVDEGPRLAARFGLISDPAGVRPGLGGHLLAVVLTHPELADEHVEDELGRMAFGSPDLDSLRGALVEHLALQGSLDVDGFTSNLSRQPVRILADELMADAGSRLEPFARRGADPGEARRGLVATLRRYQLLHIEDELSALANDPSDATLVQLQNLQEERRRLEEALNAAVSTPRIGAA